MSRLRVAAVTVASALVLAGAALAPAQAAPAVVGTDPVGDVKVVDKGGLTPKQLNSIDLRKVKVKIGATSTKFVAKIAGITSSPDFEQMVFITLRSPKGVTPEYRTDLGMSAQSPNDSFATYFPDVMGEDFTVCDPLTAVVDAGAKTISLDLPHKCVPAGPVKIRVSSATGAFRSEGPGNSRDAMQIAGKHVLK